LHIPQFIVMRESVPDRVAQEFLKQFLQAFAAGEALHTAVRQAKEWLQSMERDFPCASWLPILFQNPAMASLNWQGLTGTVREEAPPHLPIAPPVVVPERRHLRLRGVVVAVLLVSSLVLGGQWLGGWQRSELWMYDQMVRLQWHTTKITTQDAIKIRVIGITPQDTQQYGQGVSQTNIISDRGLAALIAKINQYQPQVIGLDIYRDTPQPDRQGYQQLLAALQATPKAVLVCQIGEDDEAEQQAVPSIAAPRLSPPKAIGYADGLLPDPDLVVRRYALQMAARSGAACASEQSFAWQIAHQIDPTLKLNTTLAANFGGYQDDPRQFGDDQVLVNYHPSSRNMRLYSLQDILYLNAESELTQLFKDSVVLIGYNLGGTEDTHKTPIGQQNGVMIHTHVVRQLLGQTPPMRSWPQWAEMLLIMFGAMLGGGLVWWVRWSPTHPGLSARRRIGWAIAIVGAMQLVVYLALRQSFWLSALPATAAFLLTVGLLWGIEQKRRWWSKLTRP
jgi:CHASE2 domain-containing sensor protein